MRNAALLILIALTAVPAFAAIAPELTLPVAGRVVLPGHVYTTELTITNHRAVEQYVAVEFIKEGDALPMRIFSVRPKQTVFADSWFGDYTSGSAWGVGAVRFTALRTGNIGDDPGDIEKVRDPAGLLEVKAFIINERGPFGLYGSSRQEVEGIPSSEYHVEEAVFLGVLHQPPTYTNVGITNLDPSEAVTFYVQYQYLAPVAVTVPAMSSRQIRITGGRSPVEEGNAGRYVTVTPEWATDGSGRSTPWVAYASTVDGFTGDAFSGVRVTRDVEVMR